MIIKRFEEILAKEIVGFWSPVSSSIDWCERNYVITWYIAEFWNSLSSFIIFATAVAGVLQAMKRKLELRFLLFHGSIIFVGLGSVAFHGSLTYFGQLGDELPMVWTMLIWWYILFKLENTNKNDSKLIPYSLAIYGAIFSIIHCFFAFTVFFQVHSTLLIAVGFLYIFKFSRQYHKSYPIVSTLGIIYCTSMAVAAIAWLIDQAFCKELHSLEIPGLMIRIPNPQFHAVWHALVAYSTYLGGIFARVVRYIVVYGKTPKVNWTLGFWPVPNDYRLKRL